MKRQLKNAVAANKPGAKAAAKAFGSHGGENNTTESGPDGDDTESRGCPLTYDASLRDIQDFVLKNNLDVDTKMTKDRKREMIYIDILTAWNVKQTQK